MIFSGLKLVFENLNEISIIEIFTTIFEDDKTFWTALKDTKDFLRNLNYKSD